MKLKVSQFSSWKKDLTSLKEVDKYFSPLNNDFNIWFIKLNMLKNLENKYKNKFRVKSFLFSKCWFTMMSYGISNKSFRTMIALSILGLESCSCWTGDTFFAIPKRLVIRTLAIVILENSITWAFAFPSYWVWLSGSRTIAFTWLNGWVVLGSIRAFSALFGDCIKVLSWFAVTLNTIVLNFTISSVTF